MPKVLYNGSIQGVNGKIGGLIFHQLPDGTTVVSEAPPVIHRIERRKGQIGVEATDNIGVVRVRVTVRDAQGQIIEEGEATRGRGNWWKFTPQTAGRGASILAEAWDLPKNKASLVLE